MVHSVLVAEESASVDLDTWNIWVLLPRESRHSREPCCGLVLHGKAADPMALRDCINRACIALHKWSEPS